jgi:hypothetical protein
MSRFTRIEKERKEFLEWKDSFSCSGNPKIGDNIWKIVMDRSSRFSLCRRKI